MRFFLDNDVDAELALFLRKVGHAAFTASDVGIPTAGDDVISVAADERNATLISHDMGFAMRRRDRTIGQHVWLRCTQPDAVQVMARHLDEIVRVLDRMADVVIEVRPETVRVHPPKW
ncbi:MAG: DUF5615 family PIN-like protein [Actinomycetota bacterium]